jgi:hypothetical protein
VVAWVFCGGGVFSGGGYDTGNILLGTSNNPFIGMGG